MRLKALLLIFVFSLSTLPLPSAEAQIGLPAVELTCTSASSSDVVEIHVYPGATLNGFAICTASNPNSYVEKVEIETTVDGLAVSHPGSITIGPNEEVEFQVTVRGEEAMETSSRTLNVHVRVTEANGLPPPNVAEDEYNMLAEIMQFSRLRVEATEPLLTLDPKVDYNLEFKVYNDGNAADKFRVGLTEDSRNNLEDYGFHISIPLTSIEIDYGAAPVKVRVQIRTPECVTDCPTNSDSDNEMSFTVEFFAESDFSCKYEASGCNKESVMSTIIVNWGDESNGLLSGAAGENKLLIYGGSGAGVILLLVLFIAMRRRNS
tara:strand:- start:37 stop:996 length:960 start_codon:yes stop_codon:yes gene_type:complete